MSQPPSPRARFGIRFALLARRWRRALDARLAEAGLTDATWAPLVHLDETGGGLSQKSLAALVGVDGSSLVRVIDILVTRGLVERRPDPADGRTRRIHLTPEGHSRVALIRAELARAEETILADLSDGEIAEMLDRFDRIEARFDAAETQGDPGK